MKKLGRNLDFSACFGEGKIRNFSRLRVNPDPSALATSGHGKNSEILVRIACGSVGPHCDPATEAKNGSELKARHRSPATDRSAMKAGAHGGGTPCSGSGMAHTAGCRAPEALPRARARQAASRMVGISSIPPLPTISARQVGRAGGQELPRFEMHALAAARDRPAPAQPCAPRNSGGMGDPRPRGLNCTPARSRLARGLRSRRALFAACRWPAMPLWTEMGGFICAVRPRAARPHNNHLRGS